MNIIALIVSSTFFALGFNILLGFTRFKNHGLKIRGHVKAIEKYRSNTHQNGQHVTSTYFRSIIEYIYKDETRIVYSAGTNEIRHKLRQSVTVLLIEEENGAINACLDDAASYIVGLIFALAGLVILGVYLFALNGSWLLAIIIFPGLTGAGYVIASMVRTLKTTITSMADTPKENSVIIDTQADYIKEISNQSLWGHIIALGLMCAGLAIMRMGYNDLPSKAAELFTSDFGAFWEQATSGTAPSSWNDPLLIMGTGTFFFLASLRSLYYVRKKYGGMLRI